MVAAVFMAINLNYKTIILHGADHSWHEEIIIDNNNTLSMKQFHFYDTTQNITAAPVHNIVENKKFSIGQLFLAFSKAFLGYEKLVEYAKYRNSVILNASTKTYIDAFQKITLD